MQDLQESARTTTEEQDMSVQHVESERMPKLVFEGQPVEGVVMKISGKTPIQDDDITVSVDDRILLVTECTVTSIRHYVDDNGKLIREQVLKPIRATRGQWDPTNPNDDGVVRAGALRP